MSATDDKLRQIHNAIGQHVLRARVSDSPEELRNLAQLLTTCSHNIVQMAKETEAKEAVGNDA